MFMRGVVLAVGCIALVSGCAEPPDEPPEFEGNVYVGRDAEVSLVATHEMIEAGGITEALYTTSFATRFQYQGDFGWWGSNGGYSADAVTGRMVSGDFNGDGRDDIAQLYKYGAFSSRVHVLLSTGTSFQYQGDFGWWGSNGGYSPDAVTGRMVSGDFNGDGSDDIALLYKYDPSWSRVHVLLAR
ncbi:FG-GAP repeat domain-containing protein [Myxococcus eversor]|uniref:FG-GAP repeat domain-containing protein n=1 Tax=Myxococcus eversor TaxID=2709661 RepID=UPI0013D2F2D2|nr:VCBS repeat-containing protein [Myxococcus eversor]